MDTPYFRGELNFCSNFYETPVTVNHRTYRCVEAAFQAQKDPSQADMFVPLDGRDARHLGRDRSKTRLRGDWETIKTDVMRECLRSKFSDPQLRERLAKTETPLVEETPNDAYWGTVNGHGENMLGRLLMEERDRIRAELGMPAANHGPWPPAPQGQRPDTITVPARSIDVNLMPDAQTARVRLPWADAPSGFAVIVTPATAITRTDRDSYAVTFDSKTPIRLVNVQTRRNLEPTWTTEVAPVDVRDAMIERMGQLSNQLPKSTADQSAMDAARNRLDRIMHADSAKTEHAPTTTAIPVTMRATAIPEIEVEPTTELTEDDYITFDDDSHEDEMEMTSFFHEGDDIENVSFKSRDNGVVPGMTPQQAASDTFDLTGSALPFRAFRPMTLESVRLRKNSKTHQPDYAEVTTPQGVRRAIVQIPWEPVPGKLETNKVNGIEYPPRAAIVVPVENVTTTRTFASGSRDVSIKLTQPEYKVMAYDGHTGNLEPLDEESPTMTAERIANTMQAANDSVQAQRAAQQATSPKPRRRTMRALDQMAQKRKMAPRLESTTDPRYTTNIMATHKKGGQALPKLGLAISSYPNMPDAMRIDVSNLETRKSIELTVQPVTDQDGRMAPYTAAIRTPHLENVIRQLTAYGIIAPLSVTTSSAGEYAHTVFAVRPEAALRLDRLGTEAYERDYADQEHAGNAHWREMMPQMPTPQEARHASPPMDPNAFLDQLRRMSQMSTLSARMRFINLPKSTVQQAADMEREILARDQDAQPDPNEEKPAPQDMSTSSMPRYETPMQQPK